MKRYMISPIIGAGTEASPYRVSVSDVAEVNVSAVITSKVDGTPKYGFALCVVAAQSVATVAAVTNAYVFPDYVLDGRMDGMESGVRTALKQSAEAYNLDGAGLHLNASNVDSESYRDLLTRLGQQFEPAFHLNSFDVTEVAS